MATNRYDAIVVGAGHNGMVTAAYLAKAGLRTLVLERREEVGGALVTGSIETDRGPVKVPTLAHTVGRLWSSVARDLQLARHGLRLIEPPVRAFAPQPDGRGLTLWADPRRTADELKPWSARDADAYPRFDRMIRAVASFLAHVHASTPPDIDSPSIADALTGVKLARAFRGLGGRPQLRETLRILPMAVADLVQEAFETEALRGAIASRGIQYTAMGPWSAGTAAVLLADSAGNDGGAAGQATLVRGGPGALAEALASAARSFGAEIRCGAEVARLTTKDDRATGVALADGTEISAPIVASNADPKHTLLDWIDPVALGPTLSWRTQNVRTPGTVAKLNLALDGLPAIPSADSPERLRGRILAARGINYLERAFDASKYGQVSDEPYVEATIPTLSDPTLAPDGVHVLSALVQFAPYHLKDSSWEVGGDRLAEVALKTLEALAPDIRDRVIGHQVVTPVELESRFGLTGGHPLHGEPGLDQFFAWRPLWGFGRYRMPVRGLYLCGSGAHPGGGITGRPGANATREILADRRKASRGA
jgi:phytoene dehydrogenase-like protein